MSAIARVFVVLNLVFSVLVLGSVAAIIVKGQDYRQELTTVQENLSTTQEELEKEKSDHAGLRRSYESETRNLNDQIADLQASLATKNDEVSQLTRDNSQLRGAVDGINATLGQFQTNIDNLTNRNNQLTDQLAQAREAETTATDAQRQAEDDLANLQRRFDDSQQTLASLEASMNEQANRIQDLMAFKEMANQSGFNPVAVQEDIEARVQTVDAQEGFVVLSVGSENSAVKPGYKFFVYRGNQYVGDVVVDEVLPNNSVARIEFTNPNAEFRMQDSARTRL